MISFAVNKKLHLFKMNFMMLLKLGNYPDERLATRITGTKQLSLNYRFLLLITSIVMILISPLASAQQKNLSYKVLQNNDKIGWIKLQKVDNGTKSYIQLQSEIKKRMI